MYMYILQRLKQSFLLPGKDGWLNVIQSPGYSTNVATLKSFTCPF